MKELEICATRSIVQSHVRQNGMPCIHNPGVPLVGSDAKNNAMKFSGVLIEGGLQLLERSLIPACQKTGKLVYLLLSNDTVSFVQDENEAGGMIGTAKLKTVRLLERFFSKFPRLSSKGVFCRRVCLTHHPLCASARQMMLFVFDYH